MKRSPSWKHILHIYIHSFATIILFKFGNLKFFLSLIYKGKYLIFSYIEANIYSSPLYLVSTYKLPYRERYFILRILSCSFFIFIYWNLHLLNHNLYEVNTDSSHNFGDIDSRTNVEGMSNLASKRNHIEHHIFIFWCDFFWMDLVHPFRKNFLNFI